MGTVMVSPVEVEGGAFGFFHQVGFGGAGGSGWDVEFDFGGLPAHSYMRKMRASESSAFLIAVRVTLGFSMLAQECSAGRVPVWGKTCSALRGSLSS